MKTITLKGSPISTQHVYVTGNRTSHRYMVPKARALKEDYQWQVKQQWKGKMLEKNDLAVNIIIFFKDKRRRDWDNWHKLSMDALEGIVYKDDSQIQEAHIFKEIDKDNPRIEISIL